MHRATIVRKILPGAALLLASGCAQDGLRSAPQTASASRGMFERVTGFGSNPGGLNMYKYVPTGAPQNAPLVVAMHACTQDARAYQAAGWNDLADQHGFYVLYPEQTGVNNPAGCFNWGGEGYVGPRDTSNLQRGQGENQSIIQMIDKMAQDHGIDTRRVYLMGHSGGAAQAALMTALWPDRIAGVGIVAGIPYYCTTELLEVSGCLNPGVDRTPVEWGDLARMGNPGYSGPWPKMGIWHGTADNTVVIRNQTELLEQFTDLYGIDRTPDATSSIGPASVEAYHDAGGQTLIRTVTIPGFGHGTPVDPSEGCGSTGSFFIDGGVCAAEEMAKFWGIIGGANPGDTTPPAVDITAPANGATVQGDVTVTIAASDDTGVDRVELFANGSLATTLRSAPYSYTWRTQGLASGSYALRAVAYDAAGNSASDDDTAVTVDSAVMDTQPPTVQITSPADGSTVMGQIELSASASDDYGVTEVEFLVDGVSVGVAVAAPYRVTWDASSVADGSHTIAAQARDAAGNQAEAMIQVTTSGGMAADTAPPTVTITSPAEGATVSGTIRVEAEATDDTRVAATVFLVDGERAGTGIFPPYSFIWDTTKVSTGTHAIAVTALDPAGNTGFASVTVTVERAPVDPGPGNGMDGNDGGNGSSGVDDSRWGCSASPTGGAHLGTFGLLATWLLLARRRRRMVASTSGKEIITMKRFGSALACGIMTLGLVACGGDDDDDTNNANNTNNTNNTNNQGCAYDTVSNVQAFLEGKTLVMNGEDIPTHPNGFTRDGNFGAATQCIHETRIEVVNNNFQVSTAFAVLSDAPMEGDIGTCDVSMEAQVPPFMATSTGVLVENVQADCSCFDVTVTYPGFTQEGRARISEDGSTVDMELYFQGQATGIRCADGAVGADTVSIGGNAFSGDAVQVYQVQ